MSLSDRLNPRSEEEAKKLLEQETSKDNTTTTTTADKKESETDLSDALSSVKLEKSSEPTKTASSAGGDEKKDEKKDTKTSETDKKDDEKDQSNLIKSSYEVAVKLADLQADPNSPLYSVKKFEDLGL